MFLDMRGLQVGASQFTGNRSGSTCKPAMGFAFAAGTTDGPGAFDFTQSDTNGTAFWRLVRNFIKKPSPQQEECHAPKPILLDVGECYAAAALYLLRCSCIHLASHACERSCCCRVQETCTSLTSGSPT